jgi:hypothetical protein
MVNIYEFLISDKMKKIGIIRFDLSREITRKILIELLCDFFHFNMKKLEEKCQFNII